MKKSTPQDRILAEMLAGTGLFREQKYAWAKVRYMLGDTVVTAGSVAALAMGGFIRPARKVEVGDPLIPYQLTEKGENRARQAQAA